MARGNRRYSHHGKGFIALMNDDSNFDLPPARKTPSGDPPSTPFNPGGSPWSAPLSADHVPPTGPYDPASGPWGGGYASGGSPSTPYGAPMPGYAPPPPPGRGQQGMTSPRGRRRRNWTILALASLVFLVAGGAGILLTRDGNSTTSSVPNGPVAVATDKPTPTATLKPGQTPLPTKVPTAIPPPPATAQPTAPPGQPTFTPVPTATPIPYASHATVTFTAASKSITSAKQTLTASTGVGDIAASVANVSVAVGDTSTTGFNAPETDFGSQVSFLIKVTNNTGVKQNVPQGINVTSGTKNSSGDFVACSTQNTGSTVTPLAAGANTVQLCVEPQQAEPSATYNITLGGWLYQGTSTAGGSQATWTVPSTCASDNSAAAEAAAQGKLDIELQGALPGNSTRFSIGHTYDDAHATCTPAANTAKNALFQYSVSVAGTGTETYYSNAAVQAFEVQQLQDAVSGLTPAGSWQILPAHDAICTGGGSHGTGSATSVTITCAASGLAGWKWSSVSAASTISPLIVGETKGAALATVNAVQGVRSGSASIGLTGGSYVPQGASRISYSVITP